MSDVQLTVVEGDVAQVIGAIPGPQGPAGAGVPTGGAANEVLYKVTSTFGDTAWGPITSAMIGDLQIVNADVSASAAIAGTKISPNFGSQNVVTTGTSTAASFIPTSSTAPTNGVYLPAANNVAISTGGTGRLFVDASGNVATGVATYSKPLTISNANAAIALRANSGGTYSDHGIFFAVDGTNYSQIYNDGVGQLIFRTGSSLLERLRITSAGLVGIGTASPSTKLAIADTTNQLSVTTGTQELILRANSTEAALYTFQAIPLNFYTNNQPRLTITSAGDVGIGTGSPGYKLDIAPDAAGSALRLRGGSGGSSTLQFTDNAISAQWGTIVTTSSSLDIGHSGIVRLSPGGTEKVRVTSTGLVGIGTAAPSVPLEVSSAGNAQIRAVTTDATGASIAGLILDNTGTGASTFVARTGSNYSLLGTTTNTPVLFLANNSERARIDSSGRLLVGTSTDSGGALLQVNGNRIRIATAKTPASATDTGVTGEICWDANYVYVCTATNTWKRTALATW